MVLGILCTQKDKSDCYFFIASRNAGALQKTSGFY
jgi:hypothetical protein